MPPVITTAPPEYACKAFRLDGWKDVDGEDLGELHWFLVRDGRYLIVPKKGSYLDWETENALLAEAGLDRERYRELLARAGYSPLSN